MSTLTTNGAAWYAIRTRARQEQRADMNLRAWGVQTLLPMTRGGRQVGSPSRRTMPAALFPNYLFALFDAGAMAQKIRYTRGVAQIVGTEHGPTSLDESIVDLIRSRIEPDGYVTLVPSLKAGDRVRITDGPLRDLVGVFVASTRSTERVTLLLAAMNSQMRIAVDATVVEKMPDGASA